MNLRPYQQRAIDQLRDAVANGHRRAIVEAPTGAGKTVIASELIRNADQKGKSVLFLAHARELIHQSSQKLTDFDVRHGLLMAGCRPDPYARVQVGSKDTLHSRAKRLDRSHPKAMDMPEVDLLILDEAHRSTAPTWLDVIKANPEAVVVGLTATPARPSGKGCGLGDIYTHMVKVASYEELINEGYLVPTRVFAPPGLHINLKGVKVTAGDYNKKQLEKRMNQPQLVGGIVEHWKRHASDRQTVVFASGVDHSWQICEEFNNAGIAARHVDGGTPAEERDLILAELRSGHARVVCNCAVLTEGWDCPPVSCAVLAKPTRSIVRYRQMAGRIQRPFDGKADCLILDHAGSVHQHGFPDDDLQWDLSPSVRAENEEARTNPKKSPRVCSVCGFASKGVPTCPNCGAPFPKRALKAVQPADGELRELRRKKANREATTDDKQKTWDEFVGEAIGMNMKIGYAYHRYKGVYGVGPNKNLVRVPRGKIEWNMKARDFWNTCVKASV